MYIKQFTYKYETSIDINNSKQQRVHSYYVIIFNHIVLNIYIFSHGKVMICLFLRDLSKSHSHTK